MSSPLYRPCVGIALFNAQGLVFAGERIDTPNSWQMPQGGVDKGESIQHAFFRELMEETGTDKAEILEISTPTIKYDLPPELKNLWGGKYRGQEQTWIAARFTGQDSDININHHKPPEFSRWKWEKMENLIDMIVPFKRDVYAEIVRRFSKFEVKSDKLL